MKKNTTLHSQSHPQSSCASPCNNPCTPKTTQRPIKELSSKAVITLSQLKKEPDWMLQIRLAALDLFHSLAMPLWGPSLKELNFDHLTYYLPAQAPEQNTWDNVPQKLQETFEDLGIRKAERDFLGGLGAQYESEMIYHNLKKELAAQGVLFLSPDQAIQKHPDLVQKYFASVVSTSDNKFAALNTALWSGGTFIYVPPKVQVTIPLQTYFRIDTQGMGQFERTLIIADTDSLVTYIEGCTAPTHQAQSLHTAVVEIVACKGSRVRYYTIQNWSKNVYNLVTKRAAAYENAVVEWIDGNFGSNVTMKYPGVILKEPGAKADILSVAMAGTNGQIQDSGGRIIHQAPHTTSKIISKSISCNGGRTSYRGALVIEKNANGCKSFIQCDNLILDSQSRADAYPYLKINNDDVEVGHEATVSRISDEQLFYIQSRGIDAQTARTFVINGFIEPFIKELPMEFAVEMNRLIALEMENHAS
ncbi:MAG: Fe-S cluster assembly protein SufB [Candidatus Margulisbacteria bacterium GWF2_35_9]|nr:MAG: Fe-S cluster assembly protein SufB [Candidatus Margulisbacteria bacterium GWF2_35_9]